MVLVDRQALRRRGLVDRADGYGEGWAFDVNRVSAAISSRGNNDEFIRACCRSRSRGAALVVEAGVAAAAYAQPDQRRQEHDSQPAGELQCSAAPQQKNQR